MAYKSTNHKTGIEFDKQKFLDLLKSNGYRSQRQFFFDMVETYGLDLDYRSLNNWTSERCNWFLLYGMIISKMLGVEVNALFKLKSIE